MIQFKNVTKRYKDKVAVDDLSFNIKEGEFFVLIGPSGCGKTTTLKMINRLIPLTDGFIYFNDKPISSYPVHEMRWDIGYVLQQIALFPHMTIKDNIAQVPQMKKWDAKRIDARVNELMEMVGLEPEVYKDRLPHQLSGGQRQRVGVLRALAADPPVILMDEPFSALDPISREKLQDDLLNIQSKIKKTIVFVTHDIQEAFKLGDRICLLNEGHQEQIGTPDEFMTQPKNEFVRQFIGDLDAYMIKQVTVKDIINQIHLPKTDEDPSLPVVSEDATIQDIYDELSRSDNVLVCCDGEMFYQLNRQDVFTFLAHSQRGALS
ncbi:ABC transporter ATP-binding protein [Staphylococcus massiliensis]|uniref:Carnitine transport ATP-binding protein OpuCA n=1 Tax=Staphylococcus massiliensis S46 TaxID=1229783 RepID=K9B434_9STAP|nr:ABC transporter ATP-binding protein [Staphylococcus massiliensis]EKU48545.1 putative proline/glycine betaine ABC transporter ATPase [Staphylococcus massiliensis S46]MCG3400098.1 ABC transporter ATP-binding protein [Staphylococcus massiliensis]MCG3401820.1 ABC transporter ATP-binding protein [Staphylococcus massiliensis]MCG3413153.1 ABC transporter ATP-binding protein [Staphylococcus massiliensis]PNZ97564.1 ABC transporter ATP-binding protein [Staphylococcus massiliensis CCUG 55927]